MSSSAPVISETRSGFSALMTASTSTSGVDAPEVTPTRFLPFSQVGFDLIGAVNQIGRHSVGLGDLTQAVAVGRVLGSDYQHDVHLAGICVTASCRLVVA